MSKSSELNRRQFFEAMGIGAFADSLKQETEISGMSVAQNARQTATDLITTETENPELILQPHELDGIADDIVKRYRLNKDWRNPKGSKCSMGGYLTGGFTYLVDLPLRYKAKKLEKMAQKPEMIWRVYENNADTLISKMIDRFLTKAYKNECLGEVDVRMLRSMFAVTGISTFLDVNYRFFNSKYAIDMLQELAKEFEEFQLYIERLNKPPANLVDKYHKCKKLDQQSIQCFDGSKAEAESKRCHEELYPINEQAEKEYRQVLAAYFNKGDGGAVDTLLTEWIFECNEEYGPDFLKMVHKIFGDFAERLKAKAVELGENG